MEQQPTLPLLPRWFWLLLPVLSGRQKTRQFESWLLGIAAPQQFPSSVYQKLLWINYHKPHCTDHIYPMINDHLSLDHRARDIRALAELFHTHLPPEYRHLHAYVRAQTYDLWDLPPEYMYKMDDFIHKIYFYAENDLLEEKQIINNYLNQLFKYFYQHAPLPPILEYE